MKKLLVLLMVVLLISGCSKKESYSSDYIKDSYETNNKPALNTGMSNNNYFTDGHKIIQTISGEIETTDFKKAIGIIEKQVTDLNGYIAESCFHRLNYDSDIYYNYVEYKIRIPANKTDEFLLTLEQSGNLVNKTINCDDVTNEYHEVSLKIDSLKAQYEKLLTFYDLADSIEELIEIEDRLSQLQYEIENYQNRLNNLDLLTAYSTYNITVRETVSYSLEAPDFFNSLINEFKQGIDNSIYLLENIALFIAYNFLNIIAIGVICFAVIKYGPKGKIKLFNKRNHKDNTKTNE